jgi:hypothetical protein
LDEPFGIRSPFGGAAFSLPLILMEAFGCSGGKMEKETEGSGYFEVDDAKKDGQYDVKLRTLS